MEVKGFVEGMIRHSGVVSCINPSNRKRLGRFYNEISDDREVADIARAIHYVVNSAG